MAEGDSNFTNLVASGNGSIGGTLTVTGATTLTGAVAAGATDHTGRLTTTDGVASGTAKVVGGRSHSQVAAGTALTGSSAETVLGSFSVPANTIKQGTVVRVRYQGIATATNSTDTLTVKLRCGPTTLTGTVLMTTAAVDVANNDVFAGMFEIVGRAAPGAAAACVGVGIYNDPGASGVAAKTAILASNNFATNGALLIEVTGTWSTNNAGNSCRLDVLNVDIV